MLLQPKVDSLHNIPQANRFGTFLFISTFTLRTIRLDGCGSKNKFINPEHIVEVVVVVKVVVEVLDVDVRLVVVVLLAVVVVLETEVVVVDTVDVVLEIVVVVLLIVVVVDVRLVVVLETVVVDEMVVVVKSRSVVVANVVVGMPPAGAGPHCSKHRIGSDNSDSQQSGNNSWTPSLYAESRSLHADTPKSREHSFKQQLKHSIFSSANGPQVYRH